MADLSKNHRTILKIGEAAQMLGVSIRTLRYWEEKGLIHPIKTPSGTRLYHLSAIEKIQKGELNVKSEEEKSNNYGTIDNGENLTADLLFERWKETSIKGKTEGGKEEMEVGGGKMEVGSGKLETRNGRWEVGSEKIGDGSGEMEVGSGKWEVGGSSLRQGGPNSNVIPFKTYGLVGLLGFVIIASLVIGSYYLLPDQQRTKIASLLNCCIAQNSNVTMKQSNNSSSYLTRDDLGNLVLAESTSSAVLTINANTDILGYIKAKELNIGNSTASALSVSGDTILSGNLSVNGPASLTSTVTVSGAASFTSAVTISAAANQIILGSGSTTTISTPTTAPSSARIASLPALSADDTFVFLTQSQTLTNKTLSGSSNTFSNIGNSALSNSKVTVTAGTGLSGGGDVSLGSSVTLTSTLGTSVDLASEITGVLPVAGGGTALSSYTAGDLIYASASTTLAKLNIGTEGQYLKVSSGVPAWATLDTSVEWSDLLAPVGNLSISHSSYTTTFTYGSATSTSNLFNLTDTASNTGTGFLFNVNTATSSTLQPLRISAAGTEALSVNASGNVGIGTTAPSLLLDLQRAGTATSLTDMFEITNSGNAASMTNTRSGILFNQWYYDATTPAVADSARIVVGTESNWTSTASTQDSYMGFQTALNGTLTEYMRIGSSGNVGIGTTETGNANLQVRGTKSSAASIALNPSYNGTAGSSYQAVQIDSTNDGTALNYTNLYVSAPGAVGASTHYYTAFLAVPVNGSSTNTALAIAGIPTSGNYSIYNASTNQNYFAGNVGIGTTAAGGKLDVTDTSDTAAAFSLTNNTATTIGNGANTLGVLDLQSTTLTTGNFMNIELNALTSGKGINLTSTATAFTGALADITLSGSNAANTGSLLQLTNSGTANTNTSLYVKHYATGTNNLAFRVDDESGDTTPFVIDGTGNVSIGTTNSLAKLAVAGNITASTAPSLTSVTQTLTTVDSNDSVGTYPSIAIGNDDLPVISYRDATNFDLKVTKCGNAACSSGNTTTTVDSTGSVGEYSSLAIGTDGLPIISYYDDTNDDLKVTKCGNAACSSGNTTTSVDSTGNVGQYTSIAIGTDGYPIISYYNVTNADLKVTKCGNAACSSGNTTTTVDSTGSVGDYTSIAVGTDGFPIISYNDLDNLDLKVTKCGNAACSSGNTTTSVDSTGTVGYYTSIAIGSDGLAVISHYGGTDGDLKVTKCGNAACSSGNTSTIVYATQDSGLHTSIAIGADGLPVISYYNNTAQILKITKCGNIVCSSGNTTTTLDSTSNVGQYTSIAIGADGLPVISYFAVTASDLKVARCANTSCSSTSGTAMAGGYQLGGFMPNSRSYSTPFQNVNTLSISNPTTFQNLSFLTAGAEKMTITPGGNIGIGTNAPTAILDLQSFGSATALTDMFEITNSGNAASMTDTRSGILFNQWYYDATTPAVADSGRIIMGTEGNWTSTASTQDSYMAFQTALNGTPTEYIRLTSAGNVGIGTTAPGGLLDIDMADASSITAEKITLRSAATTQTLTDGTTIASWYANQLIAPTLNGVAAGGTETVTTAATLYLDAAPSGSNITISNAYSLWSDAGLVRFDRDGIGTTATDGLFLMNNTDAAAGAQQYSPALRLRGEGWKTDATAASQNVDWRQYVVPVQGTANPTSFLSFESSVNDAAFANVMALTSAGNVGIGTTAPTLGNLTVQSGSAVGTAISLNTTDELRYTEIRTYSNGTTKWGLGSYADSSAQMPNNFFIYQYTNTADASVNQFRMVINNDGNVGIGTTAPSVPLEVKGTGTGANIAKFTDVNTTGCTLATGGTISCSSDRNLKKDFEDLDYGLETLIALNPVSYRWNFQSGDATKSLGFIAQEVEALVPNLVTTDASSGYKQLNTIGLVPILTKAIQELNSKVAEYSNMKIDDEGNIEGVSVKAEDVKINGSIVTLLASSPTSRSGLNGYVAEENNLTMKQLNNAYSIDSSKLTTTGVPVTNLSEALVKINDNFNILADAINGYANQTESLKRKVQSLEEKEASDSAQLASVNSELSTLNSELSTLHSSVASNSVDISNTLASTSSRFDEISKQIAELLASVDQKEATQSNVIASETKQSSLSDWIATSLSAPRDDGLRLEDPTTLLSSNTFDASDTSHTSDTFGTFGTFDTSQLILDSLATYDATVSGTFKALGDSFLGNTMVAGSFSIDGTMSLSGNSINSIGDSCSSPLRSNNTSTTLSTGNYSSSEECNDESRSTIGILYIQNNPLATLVDFFNGMVTIDNTGKLIVQTVSAEQLELVKDKSAGRGKLLKGQTEAAIVNDLIKPDSLVILTPESKTDQIISVGERIEGAGFVVESKSPSIEDIEFSYIIVGIRQ